MTKEAIEQLDDKKVIKLMTTAFSFEVDEVKTLFPTEEQRKKALVELYKIKETHRVSDEALGWDDTDKTRLTKDQSEVVNQMKLQKQNVVSAKERHTKRVEAELKKAHETIKAAALDESIAETKSGVTKEEIASTMKGIKELLRDVENE